MHLEQSQTNDAIRKRKCRDVLRSMISNIKGDTHCIKCNEKDPICLDFHHKEPKRSRKRAISIMVSNACSQKKLLTEIEKCVIICSNCHRKLHAELKNNLLLKR